MTSQRSGFKRVRNSSGNGSYLDLAGLQFGRWTVLERNGTKGIQPTWRCRCECGTVKEQVLGSSLARGSSLSCGCYRAEVRKEAKTHGKSKTKAYHAWQQMRVRCFNTKRKEYKNYGGRGITIHAPWIDSFEQFDADIACLGEPPWGAKFDRIDNDKNYEPGNVRWVDYFVSNRNRRTTKWFQWKGDLRTLTDIAIMENCRYNSLRNKMFLSGMSLERAVKDCQERGLTYLERAKAKRPEVVLRPEIGAEAAVITGNVWLDNPIGQIPVLESTRRFIEKRQTPANP